MPGGEPAWFAGLQARTVEAVAIAVHARRVDGEPLGISDGTAGRQFRLAAPPTTVAGNEPVVETVTTDGMLAWIPVASFAETRAGDRHVMIDTAADQVLFPPAAHRADGSQRSVGAVPPAGAVVRIDYWTGGGAFGNVAIGALRELRFPRPGVRLSVENPVAARGGRDAETIDDLWARAPRAMQARERAVTAADHEELTRAADPSLARVRCVPERSSGAVRLLLVASPPPERADRPSLADLRPTPATLAAVTEHLEPRRILGARLFVEAPGYQGIWVDVGVVTNPATDRRALRQAVLDALYAYLHPVSGGDDGTEWTFGQAIIEATIRKHLYPLPGVQDLVRVALSPVDPEPAPIAELSPPSL